ncbi:hypothetical protein Clacol_005857 [Clathrus columnatus]|uniref:Uncharacterized protein n=1 Tax=Clathrus columnatus TaxID=1419009 RepID=A0AAV5AF67_9AGAM|nr:hypothetical protein Clacol_005857 [Clathrus columnatus]
MYYSNFFTLGLSLASEPKPEYGSPQTPQIAVQAPLPRPVTRRRRSSLTILTHVPMSAVKSTVQAANEAVKVALKSPVKTEFDSSENLAVPTQKGGLKTRRVRRKTVGSQLPPPSLQLRVVPQLRFPPPTSPLPPTPLSPSFVVWQTQFQLQQQQLLQQYQHQSTPETTGDPILPEDCPAIIIQS